METINEMARETPIIHTTEVLVVGSGPGGLAAAIASACFFASSLAYKLYMVHIPPIVSAAQIFIFFVKVISTLQFEQK